MKNKKFFIGMAVLLSVSLFVTGCPTEAENGAAGVDAKSSISANASVDAADLAALFDGVDTVKLLSGAGTVEGEVPSNKVLEIYGASTKVAATGTGKLDVKGAVVVKKDAALDGSGVLAGLIYGSSVSGEGTVTLPVVGANPDEGLLAYTAGAGRAAGSYWADGGTGSPAAIASANIDAVFEAAGLDSLTLQNVADIAVPAAKTVVLNGTDNTVADNYAPAGKLVVAENAVLTVTATGKTITGSAHATDPAGIEVRGTLKLDTAVTALTIGANVDLSNATVDAASTTNAATLTLPAAPAAVKTVAVGNENDLAIAGATQLTVGSVTAGSGKAVKSATVAKYIDAADAKNFVQLATASDGLAILGLDDGVFSIGAIELGSALTLGDTAQIAVSGTALSTTDAYFALTTANLAKITSGAVAFTGAVPGPAATLVIPADLNVTVAAGTLENITGLTINDGAGLTLSADATLAGLTGIVIGDEAYLDVGAGTALNISGKSLSTAGKGIIMTSAAGGLTKLEALTHAGTVVNIGIAGVDFDETYEVPANVILVILGETAVAGTADITVSGGSGSRIYVSEAGTLTLTGGAASGSTAGKSVTVTAPVTVAAGGTLAATAGAGGTGAAGGAVTIGASGNGAKVSFEKGLATITVGLTSGAAANSGAGGAVTLYTSNAIESETVSTTADAVIDGVTLTITGGGKDGDGGDGTGTIDGTAKSITVSGGTHG